VIGGGAQRRRILLVADDFPWPETTGYRMRIANTVAALRMVGDVHLFCIVTDQLPIEDHVVPDDVSLAEMTLAAKGPLQSKARLLVDWVRTRLPRRLVANDWSTARTAMAEVATEPFDLVWYSHNHSYALLGDLPVGPVVVDLDNLEDQKLRHRLDAPIGRADGRMRRLADRLDERRWRRLQRRTAAEVATVAVCSELDRQRLGVANSQIIRNGYDAAHRVERRPADHPVLLFVGRLTYAPNADAVRFFVDEVLPLLRAEEPTVELRVVGHHGDEMRDLDAVPNVTLLGELEDIGDELAGAHVSIAPLRWGGGTRIKILEAFAHGVPVVATSVGCEGLEVSSDTQLLVADDAPGLAVACLSLLRHPERGAALAAAASEVYDRSFHWESIRDVIADVATSVARVPAAPTAGRAGAHVERIQKDGPSAISAAG
jgi:glycosyltransferase involved in cell wall biosynthesis